MKKGKLLFVLLIMFCLVTFFGDKVRVEARVIYTTDPTTNAVAEKIIKKCTTKDMSQKEKLRKVYLYLVHNMKYSWSTGHTKIKVSQKEIKESKKQAALLKVKYSREFRRRYKNVRTLQGTCYGMSMVFCILANHLGYSAHMCHGKHVTGGGRRRSDHYWCYVVVDGKKKYFDVQYANRCYHRNHSSSEVESCYLASRSSSYWKKHYR